MTAIMSLLLLGLAGCTTYGDGNYRDGYYSDGDYYYPARDGYGDYYQGPDYVDYTYASYSPFWRLDRYSCGAFYSCSPYWNNFYGRPYGGWNFSPGRGWWGFNVRGWQGEPWSPWYGYGFGHPWYGHGHPGRRPPHRDPRPPVVVDPETDDGYSGGTEPNLRLGRPGPRPIGREPDVRRPRLGDGSNPPPPGAGYRGYRGDPRPGAQGTPTPGRFGPGNGPRNRPGNDYVAPVPMGRAVDGSPGQGKRPDRSGPMPITGRGEPMATPVERSPAPPRFENRGPPMPQESRPPPPPRVERAPTPEVRPASQNRSVSDEL
jgi:hypothetical protein